ncbi:thioredoxin family protein [Paenibacillus aurantius]|uniref:Thioredoxin family protein n=1 Tax=Paenibacillus aurantius TaxID=2918900 RepID=A0AA96RDR8_9BACL|nr:thioredoxin family protein [Paenibacillus aurantius]WJH34504.1 thioredoxin family protein [Paenibacillus sp. CC-CFT747]WNQ09716.1 thioredoxin family protein [Paenibacillus aurantius]
MKKLSIYLTCIIALFAILYGINSLQLKGQDNNVYGMPAKKLNPATVSQLKDKNYQNIILPDDLKKRLQNKESLFVYYFSPTCVHCQKTTPMLYPLSQTMGIDMKQFNLLEFEDGWQNFNIQYTPTLVYYKDGKEAGRLEGENDEKTFKDFFNKFKS